MPKSREILSHYRLTFLALAASAAIHAAVIVGVPGRLDSADDSFGAIYTASLEAATLAEPGGTGSAPSPAPRRVAAKARAKPRIMPPPRIEEIAPPPAAPPSEEPAPEPAQAKAPEPSQAPEPKPETVAVAKLPATAPEPEPERFPADALPERITITYSLTSAFADGRAVYEWQRDGDRYVITSEAEAVGFFTLFLEGRIRQESRGTITSAGLRPERFVERRPNAAEEGLEFDWPGRKVTFQRPDDRRTAELKDNTVDWLSMIFQMAHVPPKGDAFELRVFTQRRMYQFHLRILGEEEIEIPIGKVRALHLRHENPAENEYVDVWLGIDHHYVPLKMRYPVARNRVTVEQTVTRISER